MRLSHENSDSPKAGHGPMAPVSGATPLAAVPPAESTRDSIRVNSRQHRDVLADCTQALRQWNAQEPCLFTRGDAIVQIVEVDGHPQIRPLNFSDMRKVMSKAADFFVAAEAGGNPENGRLIPTEPPAVFVQDMLHSRRELDFPDLIGVSELPFLRPDGSIVEERGYDPVSRLYYAPSPDLEIAPMPTRPDRQDAIEAIEQVVDVLREFPWVGVSLVNALGLLLTIIVRHVISQSQSSSHSETHGCVPLFLMNAPKPGNGKGLLTDVICLICTGTPAPMRAQPERNADEFRKSITSALTAGRSIIVWDNLEGTLKSPALAAAITTESWSDRPLGRTADVTLPQRSTFIVTGNNIILGGDLARRCVPIKLDANSSRPWAGRTFTYPNLKQHVMENRGKLVRALLIIASAWYRAGRPEPKNSPILGSFEDWSRTIGGILEFCGYAGFLGNCEELYENSDPAEQEWAAYLGALYDGFDDDEFTVAQLVRLHSFESNPVAEAMPADIQKIKDNSKSIGRAFLSRVRTRYGAEGLYLEKVSEPGERVARWRVRSGNDS